VGTPPASDHPFTPDLFARLDEDEDPLFYREPRKVTHLDAAALAAVSAFFAEVIPRGAGILDLMASWRSHLPRELAPKRVTGLGLNAEEMDDNPALGGRLVHDLNRDPRLPLAEASFDAVVNTVSIQYVTRPIEVLNEVARILRPGGRLAIVISDRCFPTKAVKIWHRCEGMRERMELVMAYVRHAQGFTDVLGVDLRPGRAPGDDPAVAIVARREGSGGVDESVRPTGWRRR
jgi:SAM-dependent methyltransferase